MLRISFTFEGVKEMDRAFNRIDAHVSDLRPVWPVVTKTIQRIESEQFKSEGAKGRSGKWKPLTRNYAVWKRKKYGDKPILERTGALMRSMTSTTDDTMLISEPLEFGYGTRLFYMPFVNKTRPVVSLTDADREAIIKDTQKELIKLIRADRQVTQSLDVVQ
jgi:phage gpG-like protein